MKDIDFLTKQDCTCIHENLLRIETKLKTVIWMMGTIGVGVLLLVLERFLFVT